MGYKKPERVLNNPTRDAAVGEQEHWVTKYDAARILGLSTRYVGDSIRNGFLKGKIGFRKVGKRYEYDLNDLLKVLEQATVPSKRA